VFPSCRRRLALLAATILATSALVRSAGAAPRADSTVADAWRLENGLEVRTLHVPRAAGVSVTLAFRAGSDYEPARQEGLSELLAELQFTCAAGDVPERTREEMASLRPLGWEVRPGSRLVRFTEIATRAQLPGVLQQTAARLAGVRVTDADVKSALTRVRRDAGARLFGGAGDALYWRSSLLARGLSDDQILRRAGFPGLEKLTGRDVTPLLSRWYQPGNASLALAGDLKGVDVRAIVQSLFGRLPGGTAMPDTVRLALRGSKHVVPWKELRASAGVVAIAAPALTDSLHPGFYLGLLVTGPAVANAWGPPQAPLASRFQYSIFDEPELIRLYPPVRADATDPDLLAGALFEQLHVMGARMVQASLMDQMRRSVRWLLGGELTPEVLAEFRRAPGGLGTVSNGLATRALWMGDAFWTDYLHRFDTLRIGHSYYYEWLSDQAHQTLLLLRPAR